jgi:predicted RNase H-like HicB family nuclease
MRYAVIVEEGDGSYGAHVPDLPGCVAVAVTKEKVL